MTFVAQLLSHVQLFVTPWTVAHQASLSFTISQSLLKLISIELMMPSNHLILYHPLLFLPSIFPSIRIFSNESALCIMWLQLRHQSFQWIFRLDFLQDSLVWSLCCLRDSQEPSPATQFKSISSSALSLLYGSTFTFIHDYDISCHLQRTGRKEREQSWLELKINCYLKQSRWHWSNHFMTNFKMTVRAGCVVSVCSPLPSSIKALVHWLSVGGAGKSSFQQKSTAPCWLASKIKQTFLSTSIAYLLAFE